MVDDEPGLLEQLGDPAYPGKVTGRALLKVGAGCDELPTTFSASDSLSSMLPPVIEQLQTKIGELEANKGLGVERTELVKRLDQVQRSH